MSKKWHDYDYSGDICCPHCNANLGWETEDVPVTYWGEGPLSYKCSHCSKEFWLEEHVS